MASKSALRLAEDRFRGYTVKYHVTYHLRVFLGWEIEILSLKCFLIIMRSHFGLKICWRLAEDRFRGYTVKYHVTYHLRGFLGGKFKYCV